MQERSQESQESMLSKDEWCDIWQDASKLVRSFFSSSEILPREEGPWQLIVLPESGVACPVPNLCINRFVNESVGRPVYRYPWCQGSSRSTRYPSWLFRTEQEDYAILIDQKLVSSVAGKRYPWVVAKLILHEFAHLKYHAEELCPRCGKARWAEAQQEQQAWALAGAIISLSLSSYAWRCRYFSEPDRVWQYI